MEFELSYTPEQEAFRKEVRAWLETSVPKGISISPREEDHPREEWDKRRELGHRLGQKGWLWPTMPKEYGGGGLTMDQTIIIDEELDRLGLSRPPYYDAGGRFAPNILLWGTDEQKKTFLPPILTGEVCTWQLLTEPEAGSDLASVKTLATRDGDDYVINGHKTFVGATHGVDQFWTICMTDPKAPRHENVSWFMIPANLPGITIMPLELMGSGGEGGAPGGHKNSVFFDNVRIPAFNLVGGENNGWKVASTHLEIEHAGGGLSVNRNRLEERVLKYCKETQRDGEPIAADQDARDLLMELHMDAESGRIFSLRNFYLVHAKKPRTYGGSQSSYVRKMAGLKNTGTMGRLLGYYALTSDAQWGPVEGYVEAQQRSGIVAVHPGGTADVQKLIMARRIGIGRTSREEAGQLV
ncbi:MAG: acyl-CoA dehydrogenase family protein [Chloroflexi bacterium]|nr:acyl-CoA dehydrogenase family protein [Chloroflexota bacterium]